MTETGTLERVRKAFDWQLQTKGYIPMPGQIVDASLVPAPSSAPPRANAEAIKSDKAAHKVIDARWTLEVGGKVRHREDGTRCP